MGLLDIIDALRGKPGWHRDHDRTWQIYTTTVEGQGWTRLQSELKDRIDEELRRAGMVAASWVRDAQNAPFDALVSPVPEIGVRIWLMSDSVAFVSEAPGQRRRTREYHRSSFRTPQDFMARIVQDLRENLRAP